MLRKEVRKLLSLVVAVFMLASVFTACAKQKPAEQAASSSKATTQAVAPKSVDEVSDSSEDTAYSPRSFIAAWCSGNG